MKSISIIILTTIFVMLQVVNECSSEPIKLTASTSSPVATSSKMMQSEIGESPSSWMEGYVLPLRIHLSQSGMTEKNAFFVAREINRIWKSQANICFQIEVSWNEEAVANGLDIWFLKNIPDWNGYYETNHKIFVRDAPALADAVFPAQSAAARTAAHEIGHALGLDHRQDSDENLMRSKTYGWKLNEVEIKKARERMRVIAVSLDNKDCPDPFEEQVRYTKQ